MAWLRNKKTGGWFEIPDEQLNTNDFMNNKIRNGKQKTISIKDFKKDLQEKQTNNELIEKIKNFDASKISKEKWSAEEEFLARMSNYYNDKDSTLTDEQKAARLRGINVIAKNDDYLLYSTKDVTENGSTGYTDYVVVTGYDKNSRFDRPPNVYINRDWKTGTIQGVEINWAAYGSVDTDKAEEFMGKLQSAVNFSKQVEKKLKGKKA